MAEYANVEKPFLDKLRLLGWHVFERWEYTRLYSYMLINACRDGMA